MVNCMTYDSFLFGIFTGGTKYESYRILSFFHQSYRIFSVWNRQIQSPTACLENSGKNTVCRRHTGRLSRLSGRNVFFSSQNKASFLCHRSSGNTSLTGTAVLSVTILILFLSRRTPAEGHCNSVSFRQGSFLNPAVPFPSVHSSYSSRCTSSANSMGV